MKFFSISQMACQMINVHHQSNLACLHMINKTIIGNVIQHLLRPHHDNCTTISCPLPGVLRPAVGQLDWLIYPNSSPSKIKTMMVLYYQHILVLLNLLIFFTVDSLYLLILIFMPLSLYL